MSPAQEYQRVTAHAFYWAAWDPAVKTELCASAVLAAEGLVFIDPIPLVPEALAELADLARPCAVVLTNGNHERAAAEYARRFGVPILATARGNLPAGTPVAGDLEVHAVPGAGPGEIALRHPAGSLHLGDALIHAEPYGFSLLPEKYCEDPRQLRESLRNLLRLEFRLLLFAHGTPLVTEARRRLEQLLA